MSPWIVDRLVYAAQWSLTVVVIVPVWAVAALYAVTPPEPPR